MASNLDHTYALGICFLFACGERESGQATMREPVRAGSRPIQDGGRGDGPETVVSATSH